MSELLFFFLDLYLTGLPFPFFLVKTENLYYTYYLKWNIKIKLCLTTDVEQYLDICYQIKKGFFKGLKIFHRGKENES